MVPAVQDFRAGDRAGVGEVEGHLEGFDADARLLITAGAVMEKVV